MLVFRNEYATLLEGSKMSAEWHSGNLILGEGCYRISYLVAHL